MSEVVIFGLTNPALRARRSTDCTASINPAAIWTVSRQANSVLSRTAAIPGNQWSAPRSRRRSTPTTECPSYGHPFDYQRSKVLAERAGWAFAAANPEMELGTVLPAFMQGPVLGSDYSGSVSVAAMLLSGKLPAIPRLGWSVADVRDIAGLHIAAMTSPKAAGERFMRAGDFLWISDMAAILRERLGDRGHRVPRRMLPNAVVRLGALVNGDMKEMFSRVGVEQDASSMKAHTVLGWSPRPAADAIVDGARSLLDHALV